MKLFPMILMIPIFNIGSMTRISGCEKCFEVTERDTFPVDLYPCLPFTSKLVPTNSVSPRSVIFAEGAVSAVHSSVSFSKIFPSVVVANMINVIDFILRPFTAHVEPSKPMGLVTNIINFNFDISIGIKTSSNRSRFNPTTTNKPDKDAGIRIILNKFFQSFLVYNALSHIHNLFMVMIRCVGVRAPATDFNIKTRSLRL